MTLKEIILKRRSVRAYTDEKIPDETLKAIVEAGLLAPSSRNQKPCTFYVIRRRETLHALAKAKKLGAGMLDSCTAAIAVFADSAKADTWVEDCSIAMSYMNLAAAEAGVGCCWCQIHLRSSLLGKDAEANVRKVLGIADEKQRIVGILALGMAKKELPPHTEADADWSKVNWD